MGLWGLIDLVASIGQWGRSGRHRPSSAERALSERRARCAVLLSLLSRVEHTFRDPGTGANLIEALDRFRVAYPT
jgi:hypothetical protein